MPEPGLAYCFQRIEFAQRMGIYCIVMREYGTNQKLTQDAIDRLRIERNDYGKLFQRISGKGLPSDLREAIKPAEKIRDKIMHGGTVSSGEGYNAIIICLEYAEALNEAYQKAVGFKPIGSLKGVSGKRGRKLHNEKTTKVILRGLGLDTEAPT